MVCTCEDQPVLPSPQNIQNSLHEEMRQLKAIISKQNQLIQNLNMTVGKVLDQNNNK